jgi:hypothetical protein
MRIPTREARVPRSRDFLFDRRRLLIGAALATPALVLPKDPCAATLRSLMPPDDLLYQSPYSAQSLWKARPINPTFGSGVIPRNEYAYAPFQAPIYYARASDPPVTIFGSGSSGGVNIPDEIANRNVTLPHFPAGVVPSPGSDAEVAIYESTTGLLHSFWQMAFKDGRWTANTYAVESAAGWGFGTPARPYNIRASGTAPLAGLLRNWEMPSSAGSYPQHALALGLGIDAFLPNSYTSPSPPGPIYPTTSQDAGFEYTGSAPNAWPMGTLFMLPSSFDVGTLSAPGAIAVAKTLMKFGAYLVDASYNTCGFFSEFSPTSSGWASISYGFGYSNADFTTIRNSLRPVSAVEGWVDGNGNPWTPLSWAQMQLLSMRGPWNALTGTIAGRFDTAANLFVVPASAPFTARRVIHQPSALSSGGWWRNWADSGGWFAAPTPGHEYTLSVVGAGALTASLSIWDQTLSTNYFTSSANSPGSRQTFSWPKQTSFATLLEVSNPGAGGQIRIELVAA